ncbi:SusC/RagA family TonB-linked outer membrane protein [Pontibacter mangrovi]|uniref:SusC/RagA family TonB-linked outer membrane protein n=1 Tax=Pontibacter mangrovi TaxID=2589816 RepID=A0A501W9W9_9BACT|nr:SusC/RagA family TonB-linked outer membrane protein [Pontibacter mangrovi]TPE44041.1 SusC/RagA family TonB-linked outer membrane protein [Pontibacter mangrovi]
MAKKLLLTVASVFLTILSVTTAVAQQRQISGVVTDGKDSLPLVGAVARIKGTSIATSTDVNGQFQLSGDFGSTDVLVVSYVGYTPKEETIGNKTQFSVSLEPDNKALDEVIVTGVATGTPKKKLGFAVAKVDAETLQKVPGTDPAAALQGKVAGVKITKTSGAPGSESDIQLRGVKTIFGSSNPLVIVDGVLTTGGLADINVQDIQSMEVLKGAAASSLYGSRAANGVISIITKRGNSLPAGKTEIGIRSEYGQSFMGFVPEKSSATNRIIKPNEETGEPEVTNVGDADQVVDNVYPKTYDNVNQFFSPGSYLTNYLYFKGNSDDNRLSAYSSIEKTDETGVVKMVEGLDRTNVKLNLDYSLTDKLDFTTSNLYAQSIADNRAAGIFGQLMNTDPNADLYQLNDDGSPYKVNVNTIAQAPNPLYNIANSVNDSRSERLLSYFALKYRPLEYLSFQGSYGTDRSRSESFYLAPKGRLDYNLNPSKGSIGRSNSIARSQTVQLEGSFFKQFGDFNTRFKGQYMYESENYGYLSASGTDLGVTGMGLTTIDLAATKYASSFASKTVANNLAALTMIDYKDKYILDALVRRDASSRFGPNVRNQIFYRVAGAWRLTEDFKINGIQEWKLRASYGVSGLRPPFEAQYETYTLENGLTSSQYTLGNKNLKPSFSKEFEAGTDIFFLNRFNFSLNYSRARNTDQILKVPLPALAGAPYRWQNAGEVLSHAFEMSLGGAIISNETFSWDASATFDKISQKITKLEGEPYYLNGTRFRIEEGIEFGTLYLDKFARSLDEVLNQVPEGMDVSDVFVLNNQGYVVRRTEIGTVNEKAVKVRDDEGNIVALPTANFTPDFNVNLANTFRYKKFSLYGLIAWQQGGKVYNHAVRYTTEPKFLDQSGKPWNEVKPLKYLDNSGQEGGLLGWDNDNLIYDATFVKLREVSLGYDITGLEKYGFHNLRFSIIGRNLLTLTEYPGFDPESGMGKEGVDTNVFKFDSNEAYPTFRTVSASISFNFQK